MEHSKTPLDNYNEETEVKKTARNTKEVIKRFFQLLNSKEDDFLTKRN